MSKNTNITNLSDNLTFCYLEIHSPVCNTCLSRFPNIIVSKFRLNFAEFLLNDFLLHGTSVYLTNLFYGSMREQMKQLLPARQKEKKTRIICIADTEDVSRISLSGQGNA